MKLQRVLPYLLSFTVVATMTGCGNAQNRVMVSHPQTSALAAHEFGYTPANHKPQNPGIPAPVNLTQLQRSNTWYNLKMIDIGTGYRWGYINGRFEMQAKRDGAGWTPIAMPATWTHSVLVNGNGMLENPNVQVVDANSVYVIAVENRHLVVDHTNDGGRTWAKETRWRLPGPGFALDSVSFQGDQDGFVLLRGTGQQNGQHLLIHLQQQATIVSEEHITPGAKDAGLPKSAHAVVSFTSPKDGAVYDTTSDGRVHMYTTSDGGLSWQSRTLNPPSALNGWKAVRVYQPQTFAKEAVFAVRYVSQKASSQVKTVVFNTKDSKHYNGQIVDRLDDATATYMGDPAAFLSTDHAFTIADGRLTITHDAGVSWKTIHAPDLETILKQYPRVLAIDALSDYLMYVLLQSNNYKQNILLFSDNGGESFQTLSTGR